MMQDLKMNVRSWDDEGEISGYLSGILQKKAFDKRGLIYGIGHAVYTLSDPRAILLSKYAEGLAENSGRQEEYKLYKTTERLAVEMLSNANNKVICANIDFYSGFVYSMLGIPPELFTPIFAAARIAGWCAHHIEERVSGGRIIRPAFKSVQKRRSYTLLNQRNKG
jgi:citrate synthase